MVPAIRKVMVYGFGLLALVAGFLLFACLLYPYESWQPLFRQFNEEKEFLFFWNSFNGTYGFTQKQYVITKVAYAGIFAGSIALVFWLHKSQNRQLNPFRYAYQAGRLAAHRLTAAWKRLPGRERLIVGISFLVLLAVRVYFLNSMRIGKDESATYMLFIDKGLPGTLFYYALPNNHIFYNLLCIPFNALFSDPFWVVELPTFLIAFFGSVLLYLVLRLVLPFAVVYPAFALFSFSFYGLFYSVHGRGYFLIAVCAVLAAVALYKITERKSERYWLIFMAVSAAGFFTVPVFLYPFLAVVLSGFGLFARQGNRAALFSLVVSCLFIGALIMLFYSPALLGSGRQLLLANDYIQQESFAGFLKGFRGYLIYSQGAVLGQERLGFYTWLAAVLFLTLLLFRGRNMQLATESANPGLIFIIMCSSVLPWVLVLAHGVNPPERVLTFKAPFDFLTIALSVYYLTKLTKWYRPALLVSGWVLVILLFATYSGYKLIRKEKGTGIMDKGFDSRIEAIRKSGARTIYSNEVIYGGMVRYNFYRFGPTPYKIIDNKFLPQYRYDALILRHSYEPDTAISLSDYRLYYRDKFVQILFRKK